MPSELIGLIAVNFFFLGFHLYKEERIFSLSVIFNSLSILYFCLGLFIRNLYAPDFISLIAFLCIIAVFAFNFAYILCRNYKKTDVRRSWPTGFELVKNEFLIFLTLSAVIVEIYVLLSVGIRDFIFIDRMERFPILKNYQALFYIANLTFVLMPIALIQYIKNDDKVSKKIFVFLLIHNLIFSILLVSRNHILLIFVSIVACYEIADRINKVKILLFSMLLVFALFFIRGYLYLLILDDDKFVYFNPGEIINWIRNTEVILKNNIDSAALPVNSYFLALYSLIDISPSFDAPSEWFVKAYFPHEFATGFSRGFSGIAEGYLYGNGLGVFLHFALIGISFSLLQNMNNPLSNLFIIFICYASFRLFRSEIYNFTKYFYWYYFVPIILIYFFDRILSRVYFINSNKKAALV